MLLLVVFVINFFRLVCGCGGLCFWLFAVVSLFYAVCGLLVDLDVSRGVYNLRLVWCLGWACLLS